MPYLVHFGLDGKFSWQAPYKDGSAIEIGEGMYLGPVHLASHTNGSWEAHYYGANRFQPDSNNGTNCCCEYVGSKGVGYTTVLADYFVKVVHHSNHRPMEEVCAAYAVMCPTDNLTASVMLAKPFIEMYERPAFVAQEIAWEQRKNLLLRWAWSMAVMIAILLLCFLARKFLWKLYLTGTAEDVDCVTDAKIVEGTKKGATFMVPNLALLDDKDGIGTPSTLSPCSSAPNSPRMEQSSSSSNWSNSLISRMSSTISTDSSTLPASGLWSRGLTEPAPSSRRHQDFVTYTDKDSLSAPLIDA